MVLCVGGAVSAVPGGAVEGHLRSGEHGRIRGDWMFYVCRTPTACDVHTVGGTRGCLQGGQAVLMDHKFECCVFLTLSRRECCVHQECKQALAQPCLLQSGPLSSEVVTALLHNLQHFWPVVYASTLHVRGTRLPTSGHLPVGYLPVDPLVLAVQNLPGLLTVCLGSGSLVMLLPIAQVGSHGNGADVPLVFGSEVLHHVAEVDVCLHRAVH